ncbi:MAG: LamB/YcsF family protein [Eubacteriales bacterium]|nr:LamB/YcsF family protein [Eubacteriales bacterium]
MKIDLNSDLGESFGAYKIGNDENIIPLITSANIACGYHAGDPLVMDKTLLLCKENGTSIGAHPGFPDLMGFGRRQLNASPKEVEAYVTYQIGALDAFCRKYGLRMNHVKPHGALYNMAVKNEDYAIAIVNAVKNFDSSIKLLAPFGSQMIIQAEKQGLDFACEIFADRAYESDGSLVARTKEGAMITDENEAVERVLTMITDGSVKAINGDIISIKADSVCVHGDGAKALAFVEKLRTAFAENGIYVEAM